jgi:hypothetical protein
MEPAELLWSVITTNDKPRSAAIESTEAASLNPSVSFEP